MSKRHIAVPLLIFCALGCAPKPRENPDLTLRKKQFAQAASELPSALTAAKKAGLFTLPKYKPVPARENAAPEYKKAFVALKDLMPPIYSKLVFSSKAKPKDIADALETHQAGLELIREASRMPRADFGPMVDGWALTPDWLIKLDRARKLLMLDARYQAANGEKAKALEDLRTLLRIIIQTKDDERFSLQMTAMSASMSLNSSIQHIINRLGDPDSARQLIDIVSREPLPPGLGVALPHELASEYYNISSDLYRVISNPDSPVSDSFAPMLQAIEDVPGIPVRDGLRARLLQFFTKFKNATNQKGITFRQEKSLIEKITNDESYGDATHCLNNVAPDTQYSQFMQTWQAFLVQKTVTLAGLRILADRKDNLWPQALPMNTPRDPATDSPLHYRSSASGFVVYSVGEDHNDNLGESNEKGINPSFRFPQDWKVVPDKPKKAKK